MAEVARLKINNSFVAGDLTDYPVYVDLADLPSSFWNTVANGGGDIRVFKSDGTTELPREVVSCDTSTETGELHFKYTGTLSGSVDTEVQIHADGTSADYAAGDTYGRNNVWTGYSLVSHTQSGGGSSTGSNDLTARGTVNYNNAKILKGADFGTSYGTTNSLGRTDGLGINLSSTASVGFWIKLDSDISSGTSRIFSWRSTTGTAKYTDVFYEYNSGTRRLNFFGGAFTSQFTTNVTLGTGWNRVIFTFNGSTTTVYVNGSSIGSGSISNTNGGNWFWLNGASDSTTQGTPAIFDENIATSSVLSANWITTEYNNQNSPSTFYTATEPGVSVESPTISITATLNAPTLAFEDALAVNAPTLNITTTFNVPSLTYIDALEVAPPTLDFTLTMNAPSRIRSGNVSNMDKNQATGITNQTKNNMTVTNRSKS
jgi:hypothetical protein